MTCLEHLIENTLEAFKRHEGHEAISKHIEEDPNLQGAGITADQCWEICQYVWHTFVASERDEWEDACTDIVNSNRRIPERTLEIVLERDKDKPCMVTKFTINGIDADAWDFGQPRDMEPYRTFGCGRYGYEPNYYMLFVAKAIRKYGISEKEYREVVKRLKEFFSFGSCSRCP